MTIDKTDLESWYQHYLQKVKLKEEDMHPVQKVELKRAFMGGVSTSIVMMQEISDTQELDKALQNFDDISLQVMKFWENEK